MSGLIPRLVLGCARCCSTYIGLRGLVIFFLGVTSFPAISNDTFRINISPMSRYDALISLAYQSGYDILFGDRAIPQDQFFGEIEGDSVTEVLDVLLEASDLDYQMSDREIRIVRNTDKRVVLPKITVLAYLRNTTAVVIKNDESQEQFPLYQIPLSIQSIPRKHIDDVQAHNLGDALSYISGVEFFEQWGGMTPQYQSRGVPAIFGIDGKFYRRVIRQLDPAVLERIDVVQGPRANYFQPGGMLNLVTKKPKKRSEYELSLKVGTNDFYRGVLDLNFSSGDPGSWSTRLILVSENQNHWKNLFSNEKNLLSSSTNFHFSPEVELLVTANYASATGYPTPFTFHESILDKPLDEKYTIGVPWEKTGSRDANFNADLSHYDWNGWHLSSGVNIWYGTASFHGTRTYPLNAEGDVLMKHMSASGVVVKDRGFDLSAERAVSLFGTPTLLRVGFDYQRSQNLMPIHERPDLENPYGGEPFNVHQRSYYSIEELALSPKYGDAERLAHIKAIHISQHFYFWDDLTLYTDFRYEDMSFEGVFNSDVYFLGAEDGDIEAVYYPETVRRHSVRSYKELTPQFGLNYNFNDSLSSHFSYSESFTSQSILIYSVLASEDVDQKDTASPITTRQLEWAIKKKWLDETLWSSVTVYKIKSSNILTANGGSAINEDDPQHDQSSTGVDFSINGSINKNLTLIANVNYNKNNYRLKSGNGAGITYYFSDESGVSDTRLHGTAKYRANAWLNYEVPSGLLKNFDVGLGAKYLGDRYGDNENTFKLTGYTKVDANIEYKGWPGFTFAVSVRNVFDKDYYKNGRGEAYLVEKGEPRSIFLTIKTSRGF